MKNNPTQRLYTDDVRGHVIGDITVPCEFWADEEITPGYKVQRCVARGHFANDNAAVAWFRKAYPLEYAKGVTMRVYDQ
jgi:hypothetical protein